MGEVVPQIRARGAAADSGRGPSVVQELAVAACPWIRSIAQAGVVPLWTGVCKRDGRDRKGCDNKKNLLHLNLQTVGPFPVDPSHTGVPLSLASLMPNKISQFAGNQGVWDIIVSQNPSNRGCYTSIVTTRLMMTAPTICRVNIITIMNKPMGVVQSRRMRSGSSTNRIPARTKGMKVMITP